MKGATAELWAKITNPPNSNNTKIMGVSHHHFLSQKKRSKSPAMPIRLLRLSVKRMELPPGYRSVVLFNDILSDSQHIHPALRERVKSLLRSIHNRLPFEVERSIENQGNTGRLGESFDQAIVLRTRILAYRLEPSRTIHVSDGRNDLSLIFFHVNDIKHEPGGIVPRSFRQYKEFVCLLSQHRRRKRTKRLPELYLGIDDILHVRSSWV